MPSSVYLPNGWQLPIALRIHLTGPGAGFILLWAYSSLWGILVLPAAMGDVDALRAAGTYIPVPGWLGPGASTYNPVPGWLGPGAWLAYWLTTLAALARARRALFVEKTPAVDGAEPDADEAWDPDLTASALFTLFAAVALLGDSRARAGIDANRLVLCAESLAVLAGLCTGYLGSVFWLGVVQGPGLREGCLSAPGPLMRTALRRLATYGVLLVGSASVLLVFSLRMNSHVLLTAARERGYAVLVYDTLYEGSIARLALFVLLEFVVKVAAVLSSLARGTSWCPRSVRRSPDPPLNHAPRRFDVPCHPHPLWHVPPEHGVARLGPTPHGDPGHAVVPELGHFDTRAGPACAARHSGPRRGRPGIL
jgi:hypothetical protein